jgi:hypothetical protein
MSVEPLTGRQIGGLRDRTPEKAEHRFASVRRRFCTVNWQDDTIQAID